MRYHLILFLALAVVGCKKEKNATTPPKEEPNTTDSKSPLTGMRIAWDYSTLKKVSTNPTGSGYNAYARVIQLQDKSLLLTYEANGSVVVSKSTDLGTTWSSAVIVKSPETGINMAVPDLLQLKDGSILIMYNPRPVEADPSRKFQIRTQKSYDGGASWTAERILYTADYRFENGCWEPAAIQLPNGEIQLFFANEGIYLATNEQNISMVSSIDGGLTWSADPKIVSFRAGKRDGMPVPILLNNQTEIAFAIEDNGFGEFKPYIIKNTIADNWSSVVDAASNKRTSALLEPLANNVYAGAPYLKQLTTGQTILSYQGTENRINDLAHSEMKVVIGDASAKNFTSKTVPFKISSAKSGLWNSLSVLEDNTIIALTGTNAFGAGTEVWMIKGYPIYDVEVSNTAITIDGDKNESLWNSKFPVFVGHQGNTNVKSNFSYDQDNLYIINEVKDSKVFTASSNAQENDGVTFFIDPKNKSYKSQAKETYLLYLSADNKLIVQEGSNGKWVNKTGITQIKTISSKTSDGYLQEMSIPWSILGGKPANDSRIGVNLMITENKGTANADYKESAVFTTPEQPFTWLTLKLK